MPRYRTMVQTIASRLAEKDAKHADEYYAKDVYKRQLHTKAADGAKIIEAETQSMFGSVEDLIAMGYSGNLERCV